VYSKTGRRLGNGIYVGHVTHLGGGLWHARISGKSTLAQAIRYALWRWDALPALHH
jgi:hypothetical protein